MLAFVGLAAAFLPTHRHHRPVQSQLRGGLWRTVCSAPESPDAALDELIRREVEAAFAGIDLESEGGLDQLIAEKGDAVMRSVLSKLESDGEQLAATLEDQVAAYTKEQQLAMLRPAAERCICYVPKVRAQCPKLLVPARMGTSRHAVEERDAAVIRSALQPLRDAYYSVHKRTQVFFPDRRLVQFDCGKLQVLDPLLRKLKSGGHRVLIFTQMSSMLDILEQVRLLWSNLSFVFQLH